MGTERDSGRQAAKRAYSPAEVADELGVSERTVQRLMASGRLRYVQVTAGLRRIPADALDELLEAS